LIKLALRNIQACSSKGSLQLILDKFAVVISINRFEQGEQLAFGLVDKGSEL